MGKRLARVLVAQSETLITAGLQAIVRDEEDLEIEDVVHSAADAADLAHRLRPDVVLMDIRLLRCANHDTTRDLFTPALLGRRPFVLLLCERELGSLAFEALLAGARGVVLKDTSPFDLCGAIRDVAGGEGVISREAGACLIDEFARRKTISVAGPELRALLTERERDVLAFVVRGYTNGEIARCLALGETTVKSHVQRLLGKLRQRDRIHLIIHAYESGLIDPRSGVGGTWRASERRSCQ